MRNLVARAPARRLCLMAALVVAAVALGLPSPTPAREALGDLDLGLRVVEVAADAGPSGTGTATVDILLSALVSVHDLRFTFLRSDGTPFAVAATPIDGSRLAWRRPGARDPEEPGGNDPEEPGDVSIDKGGVLGTRLHVLLPRTGLYEIVVKVVGTGATGPVSTETMVRIPFGTALPAPVEREGVAEFTVKEGRP